jgi:hypothetical protein
MSVNTRTKNGVIRELAIRYMDGGGTVALYWNSETEEISLAVTTPSDDFTVGNIPPDAALDAWNHPYAYADYVLKTGKSRLNAAA